MAKSDYESNPSLFRELAEPFKSMDEADAAMKRFHELVKAARVECRLTNVLVTVSGAAITDGEERAWMTSLFFGDAFQAESLAAWSLGNEQARRQEVIGRMMRAPLKDRR